MCKKLHIWINKGGGNSFIQSYLKLWVSWWNPHSLSVVLKYEIPSFSFCILKKSSSPYNEVRTALSITMETNPVAMLFINYFICLWHYSYFIYSEQLPKIHVFNGIGSWEKSVQVSHMLWQTLQVFTRVYQSSLLDCIKEPCSGLVTHASV